MNEKFWEDKTVTQKFKEEHNAIIEKIRNANFLIIDDDEQICTLLQRMLKKKNIENTTIALTGGDALKLMREEEYEIIFLDLHFPDMEGLDVLNQIKTAKDSKCNDSLVIILTGLPTVETAVKGMHLGAYTYVAKPIEMAELFLIVEKSLAKLFEIHRDKLIHKYFDKADEISMQKLLQEKDDEIKKLKEHLNH